MVIHGALIRQAILAMILREICVQNTENPLPVLQNLKIKIKCNHAQQAQANPTRLSLLSS